MSVQRVLDAWNNPGIRPDYHAGMKRFLRYNWPVLYHALEGLAEENRVVKSYIAKNIVATNNAGVRISGYVCKEEFHGGSHLLHVNLTGTTSTVEIDALDFTIEDNQKETIMAKYTVVIPVKGTQTTTNNKGEIVGIPFLGQAQRLIMNEDEFPAWLEAWQADTSMGKMFYIERHAR